MLTLVQTMWFPFLEPAAVPPAITAGFEDVAAAIKAASYRVRDELRTARFPVDGEGYPESMLVRTTIQDATLAQLAFWADTGDSTGAAAQNGGGSILSVQLPGGSGTTDLRAKQDARTAPAVTEILRSCPGIDWAVTYR